MISIRSPAAILSMTLMAVTILATVASAHHDHHHNDHHHHWNFGMWNDGKQTQTEAFANCLCWNTTSDNWCHHPLDGDHHGFFRDSCARVVGYHFFWWIFPVMWCMYLVLMPLCVCAFRLCCNCCGGRTPSFGCCCPISNRVLSPDPKWVRPYSRCSTFFAKILALCVFIAFCNLSVHGFVLNHTVHLNVQSAASAMQNMIVGIEASMDDVMNLGQKYTGKNAPTAPNSTAPLWTIDMTTVDKDLNTAESNLARAVSHLSHVSRHEQQGRAQPTYYTIACPLVIVSLVTIFAFCNVRSWPISISAGLLSFCTFFIVILASVTASVSIGVHTACDNLDVVQNFTQQLFTSNGYCGLDFITQQVNATQVTFATHLCKDLGLSTFTVPSTGFWGTDFCSNMFSTKQPFFVNTTVINAELLNMVLTSTIAASKSGLSVTACAGNPACAESAQASKIQQIIYDIFGGSLQNFYAQNYKCNVVATKVRHFIAPSICNQAAPMATSTSTGTDTSESVPLGRNLHRLAGLLFGLSAIATVAFWVYMHGSKRFTKSASKAELLGHHEQMRLAMANQQHDAEMRVAAAQAGVSMGAYQAVPAIQQGAVQPGVYNDGVNGPSVCAPAPMPTTATVAATTEQPLLLHHSAPTYSGDSNVNTAPVKEQPEEV